MDIMKKLNIQLGEDVQILIELMRTIAQDSKTSTHNVHTSSVALIDLTKQCDDDHIQARALEHSQMYVDILSSVIPAIEEKAVKLSLVEAPVIADTARQLFLQALRSTPSKRVYHRFVITRTGDKWSLTISIYAGVKNGYVHRVSNTWSIVDDVLPVAHE